MTHSNTSLILFRPQGWSLLLFSQNPPKRHPRTSYHTVSSNGHSTEWISELFFYHLKSLVHSLPSYIKDTITLSFNFNELDLYRTMPFFSPLMSLHYTLTSTKALKPAAISITPVKTKQYEGKNEGTYNRQQIARHFLSPSTPLFVKYFQF